MTTLFKKGEIVTLKLPKTDKRLAGVITKSTQKDLVVATDKGDGTVVTFGAAANKRPPISLVSGLHIESGTDQPISAALQRTIDDAQGKGPSLKKGQIVSYEFNGEQCTGRINKGGKTPLVTHKSGDCIKSPASQLTPCEAPQIDPELADWDVSKFVDEGMGRDFARWTATVTHKGNAAFLAVCDGDGGPLRYEPLNEAAKPLIEQWENTLKQYVESRGESATIVDELWPSYQWDIAPCGVTFIDYINDIKL